MVVKPLGDHFLLRPNHRLGYVPTCLLVGSVISMPLLESEEAM